MIRNLIIACLFIFPLAGYSTSPKPESKSEDVQLSYMIMKNCVKTLSEKHQMYQCGQGGAMMYEIEDLFLAFTIYRPLSKEEARAILIDCAHEVISAVNQCPEIQKYLLPEGFTEKSVQIQIYIKPNKQTNYYPDLCVCAYNFGRLAYHTNDPKNIYVYKTSEREAYQEAISLLEKANALKEITQLKLKEPDMQKIGNYNSSNDNKPCLLKRKF